MLLEIDASPSRKRRYRSRAKLNTVSTFRWSTVATDGCASFKEIDGQVKNRRRKIFYFAMMICCCKQMWVLQTSWWTDQKPKETLFLLCDDDPLLETDASPSNKSMDRSTTEGETVSTLRWWSVPADRCASFKQIDGQVENGRRKCLYFGMMKCCCYQSRVLSANWWTGGEPKETFFYFAVMICYCWSRTEAGTDFTSGSWCVLVIRCHCQ